MTTVHTALHHGAAGTVAVLTITNPPVNAMSMAVRIDLLAAVRAASDDPGVQALVLIGAGDRFIPGADIREFGKPHAGPGAAISGRDVIAALEACPKPVIAALGVHALGGGLEIALGCHFRVAAPGCKLGLPEVNIGLLPGAGGTQRLPRLVGPARALELITSGKPMSATEALAAGVIDAQVDGPLLDGALAFAQAVLAEGRPLQRVSERNDRLAGTDAALFSEFRARHAKKWRGQLAPQRIVDCIEAACTRPFAEAYAFELAAFDECKASPQRAALIHVFQAEREAARIPGLDEHAPQPIRSAAVIGAGTMGGGIAMCFANAGLPVWLLDASPEALARGRALIEKNYATSVARGSLTQAQVDRALALITGTLDYAAISDADIVVEAAFEDLVVKKHVFQQLDAVMKPGAVLATNTSTLDIDKIAGATTRPQQVIGAHFFSPANVMKLLEVVRGTATSPQAIATTMALARTIGKTAVLSGNADGFIGNRILAVYGRECDFLLEEGATPWQVDRALQGFGFPMGLYLMRDMAGLDVGWRIRQYREQFRDKALRYSPIADRLCELGRFGQKTGAGYYRYTGRDGSPDPAVEALIEAVSREKNIERRPVRDDEIVSRVLTAMANEGLKIVGEGIALREGDIDAAYVHGYGFPRHQGGPMYWAAQQGWDAIHDTVTGLHAAQGPLWAPAPRLAELAAEARSARPARAPTLTPA